MVRKTNQISNGMKKLLLITFLFLLFFALIPVQAQAAGLVPCGYDLNGDGTFDPATEGCRICHLFEMSDRIMDFVLLRIVPAVAVLMLMAGGVMFMLALFGGAEMLPGGAKGGPKTLNTAKRIITSVIVGLVIILAAYLIVGTILQAIGLSGWTKDFYQNWWQDGVFQIDCQ